MNTPVRQAGSAGNVNQMLRGNGGPAPRSEATQVEQSRAVAEVQAMVIVAQSRRRDVSRALEAMQQACGRMALAERAFFSFKRGGSSVNGASVQLARELARCWGNVNHGVRELDRDDIRGRSEMLAFGWDLETNLRADVTFIVPHMRDKTGGPVPLTELRDVYENNANNAARRLREMIFACLPVWFREEGIALCRATLEKGESDEPLPLRISKMLAAYAGIGVSRERIEARLGGNVETMTVVDLANYGILFRSIRQGEASKDEEFPGVTAAQVGQMLNPTKPQSEDGGQAAPPAAAAADTAASQEQATGKRSWKIADDVVGQEPRRKAFLDLLGMTETEQEIDDLTAEHQKFLEGLGRLRAEMMTRIADRKAELGKL